MLIYCMAVVVSGFSSQLTDPQRWFFVVFDITFPLIVLYVFRNLVVKHHQKLYAPRDWKNEELFFGPQTSAEKHARLISEAEYVQLVEANTKIDRANSKEKSLAEQSLTDWLQKTSASSNRFISAVQEAERLAQAYLVDKYGNEIRQEVTIRGGLIDIGFDAVLVNDGIIHLFEIKMIRRPASIRVLIRELVKNLALVATNARNYPGYREVRFTLVLVAVGHSVHELGTVGTMATEILSQVKGVDVDVELLDIAELRKNYPE